MRVALGYFINPDLRLLYIRGEGVVTQRERIHTMLAWLRDPGYADCVDALFDVSNAQSTPRVAEMRELISLLRQHELASGPQRLAVVTSKPIAFGVAEVFSHFLKVKGVPLQVKVFMKPDAAWTWLLPGTPPPDLR
jgi:hypothetical protein